MVALLATQIARGIVVKRDREAGERASRLALLGHSMSAVLHDMRTPMTAVGGYAELMAAEDDPQLRTEYIARIGRALEHMETMTQEVLAFARGKRDVLMQKVYMDRFVEEVRELLVPETQRYGVDLVIDTRYEGTARFDESKIKRVIFNLARNACQAMGSGGGTFTWRVAREDDVLIFECADTGPGISPEMEGKLFESFASHGKSDGTGLGLAMAKKIVDAHSGTIECLSQPGRGATFRIAHPLLTSRTSPHHHVRCRREGGCGGVGLQAGRLRRGGVSGGSRLELFRAPLDDGKSDGAERCVRRRARGHRGALPARSR